MKNARLVLFVFAIFAVAGVLLIWQRGEQSSARADLQEVYQLRANQYGEETHFSLNSGKLKDLSRLADLTEKAKTNEEGVALDPHAIDLTGSGNLLSLAGATRFPQLESLIAIDCPQLASADGVAGSPSLTQVVLTHNIQLSDVSGIRDLPTLKTLDLTACERIETLDLDGVPNLENLYLSGCRRLKRLDLSAVPKLKMLHLDGCMALTEIVGLGSLQELTDLDVSNCQDLKHLDGLASLAELIVLDMRNIEIDDFSIVGSLPKLNVLRMGGQGELVSLEPFSQLAELSEIHLEACPNLESLAGLPVSVRQYAGFTHCHSLTNLDGIETGADLKEVDLTGCRNLTDISQLSSLKKLSQLALIGCRQVTDISVLEQCPELRIIALGNSGVTEDQVEALKKKMPEAIFDFSVLD